MAYLIECDRCGKTEPSRREIPKGWLEFEDLCRASGHVAETPVKGGVFCPACVLDLARWRVPIPRAKPIDPDVFKTLAQIGS